MLCSVSRKKPSIRTNKQASSLASCRGDAEGELTGGQAIPMASGSRSAHDEGSVTGATASALLGAVSADVYMLMAESAPRRGPSV